MAPDTGVSTVKLHGKTQSGFSLIELLVVILIIGLAIRFVSFSIGGNSQRQMMQEVKQFVNASSLIAEEAVLSRQQWGVDFYRESDDDGDRYGYRWLVQREGIWVQADPVAELPIDVQFSPDVQLRLEFDDVEQEIELKRELVELKVEDNSDTSDKASESGAKNVPNAAPLTTIIRDGNDEMIEPHVWVMSSGEMTPFKLFIFDAENDENPIVVDGDEMGRVNIDAGEADDERS